MEEGSATNTDNVLSYNMSQSIEKQLDIDKIILSKWKTFMALGNFRFVSSKHGKYNLTLGTDLIILVDTVLILSKKRFCEENLDFLFSISQIGRPIGGHPRV